MKKKLLLAFALVLMLSCLLVVSVGAEEIDYSDAEVKSNLQFKADEIVEFDDGFTCPAYYVFTDDATIGGVNDNNSRISSNMDFTYINGKTGKEYSYANVVGVNIPTGITTVGKYAGKEGATLKWVSLPSTVTGLGNAIFENASALEYCDFRFEETNPLTQFPSYMFAGCKNLQAFSMPDCFTEIYDRYTFTNCTNMKAVYLSKNLTTWSSGGGGVGGGTFDYCNNMYFVNEPFGLKEIPEKPEVYYFPSNLTSRPDVSSDFSVQSTMRDCKSLNNVLVFGNNVKSMSHDYFFQNGPKNTVVFLADMDELKTGTYWGTTTFYFANPADKSTEDLTYTLASGGAKTLVFCNAEGNTTHLQEKIEELEATCEENKAEVTYCFCGAEISRTEVENTATGHDYDYKNGDAVLVAIVYASYTDKGAKTVTCGNCNEDASLEATELFVNQGYSAKQYANGGISVSFVINHDAIEEYTTFTGNSIKYGVFAVAESRIGTGEAVNANGTTATGVASVDFTERGYDMFAIRIVGFETDTHKNAQLALGAYVIENGSKVSYLQVGTPETGAKYSFVTFNELA